MCLKSCWESCVHYYHNTWGEFWNEIFGSSSEEWLMWVSIFAWCELNGPRTDNTTQNVVGIPTYLWKIYHKETLLVEGERFTIICNTRFNISQGISTSSRYNKNAQIHTQKGIVSPFHRSCVRLKIVAWWKSLDFLYDFLHSKHAHTRNDTSAYWHKTMKHKNCSWKISRHYDYARPITKNKTEDQETW